MTVSIRDAQVRAGAGRGPGDRIVTRLRWMATAWGLAAAGGLVVGGWLDRIPHRDGPGSLDPNLAIPVQLGVLGLMVAGLIVAMRFEGAGAVVIAVAVGGLGVLAGLQYPAMVAASLAAVLFVPAFLHWLSWQRERSSVHLVAMFAITALLVGTVYVSADRVYASYFGPAAPASTQPPLDPSPVLWSWAGGTTPTGVSVVAKLAGDHDDVRILLGERPDLADAVRFEPAAADREGDRVVRARFEGLRPATEYRYALALDGVTDTSRQGVVRTFPVGPTDFSVAFGSCAVTGSNAAVYDTIRSRSPLLYLNDGDLHYGDITADDPDRFRTALDATLTAPAQSRLYRSTSVGYVWDDHDYAGNDANETARSRPAAELVYREYVPHWPLTGTDTSGPIYQAFTVGRVRFVLTDNRSTRTPQDRADDAGKRMLGSQQLAWLRAELDAAARRDGVVVWVNSDPWIEAPEPGGDGWGGYTTQRREVADLIAERHLEERLVMVAGDAHMLAYDDGTHSDFSTPAAGGFPVIQAGALDRPGGVKGGPYTDGPHPGAGQFGLARIQDGGGDTITMVLSGHTWDERTVFEHTVVLDARAR